MTGALQRTNRPILFLPDCLTPSYVDANTASLLEFTNRQILITKVYSNKMWASAAVTHLLYCATLLLGAYVTLLNWMATLPAFHLALLTFVPMLLASIRGALRVAAATEVLPAARSAIISQPWIYILLGIL